MTFPRISLSHSPHLSYLKLVSSLPVFVSVRLRRPHVSMSHVCQTVSASYQLVSPHPSLPLARLSHDSDVSSRRHSLDSTRSLYRSEADRVAALLGGRRRGRRRALADVRRAGRLSTRLAVGRSDSTLSRRSSSVLSQASSSISSQVSG